MAKRKKKKVRVNFRKNREVRTRRSDWTKDYKSAEPSAQDTPHSERISGKGELTRKRTVIATDDDGEEDRAFDVTLSGELGDCLPGRVLRVGGLHSHVQAETGEVFSCATRRLLKTLSTDQRHVVVAGDRVLFRPTGIDEGVIEHVMPRDGVISRTSRGRRHTLVANVDQLVIVSSAAEPRLKPNLIDRFLATAEYNRIHPVICINKVDLVDLADLQVLVGSYGQIGYTVLPVSASTGRGIEELTEVLKEKQSVVAGQSGVGKTSLLNAVEPDLGMRVGAVSDDTQKGRHTTTSSVLVPLCAGGFVVDTPGIRQFELWDIIPEEVAALYPDIRPFVSKCRYPDCTHTHETDCAVKDAVADDFIDVRRYESYCQIVAGDAA